MAQRRVSIAKPSIYEPLIAISLSHFRTRSLDFRRRRAPMYHPSMPERDPLQILLSHDRWASAQILGAYTNLTADQFDRRFDIGPGSLHDTLTHILGAMRAWTDNLIGREPRPRLETDRQR